MVRAGSCDFDMIISDFCSFTSTIRYLDCGHGEWLVGTTQNSWYVWFRTVCGSCHAKLFALF